jgi:NAD(P)H-quinone oxidoreductase subunit 5
MMYDCFYNHGYIYVFLWNILNRRHKNIGGINFFFFFDIGVIDGITNKIGFTSFFAGKGIKYIGGGSISFYFYYIYFMF